MSHGEKIAFSQFVLQCARSFNSFKVLDIDPFRSAIPDEIPPDPFEMQIQNALNDAKQRLVEAERWDDAAAERAAQRSYENSCRRRMTEGRDVLDAYEPLLATANAWVPPTPEHEELAKSVIEQVTEIVDQARRIYGSLVLQRTGEAHRQAVINDARQDILNKTLALENWRKTYKEHTEWVYALRRSLPSCNS